MFNRYCITLLIFFIGCQSKGFKDNQLQILAKVGNRVITLQDYLHRSEYSLRPDYCRGNLYIHKKIILNNLIAEKLLAIESDKVKNNNRSNNLLAFLKGRKEQAMRQLLYYEKGYKKVELKDDEINHFFKISERTYHVNYFSFPGGNFADSVNQAMNDGIPIEKIYSINFEGNIPSRDVSWIDNNDPIISDKLFNNQIKKGDIIGPYTLKDGSAFLLKVNGWTDHLDLSEKSYLDKKEKVINTLKDRKGREIYRVFIGKIMKGKEINFNKDVFLPYSQSIQNQFFRSRKQKENAISNALFDSGEFLSL